MANRGKGKHLLARLSINKANAPYVFLSPGLLMLAVFVAWPVFHALLISLQNWSLVGMNGFAGLANYRTVLSDGLFYTSVKNTLVYCLGTVPVGIALSLALAILLDRALVGRAFFRGAYFFPSVISMVVVALVWQWLFNQEFGFINYLLTKLGMESLPWLTNPGLAMWAVIGVSIWKNVGYYMIIFLAGLQNIPEEYKEAAKIDGAGGLREFIHIVLPLLRPTTLFVLIISIISSFFVFDQVYVMTSGGPAFGTITVVQYIYREAFEMHRMSIGSAAAFLLFMGTLLVTFLQLKLFREE